MARGAGGGKALIACATPEGKSEPDTGGDIGRGQEKSKKCLDRLRVGHRRGARRIRDREGARKALMVCTIPEGGSEPDTGRGSPEGGKKRLDRLRVGHRRGVRMITYNVRKKCLGRLRV